MRAVEILKEEHRLLRRALLRLETLLRRATSDERLDGVAVGALLEFLERFADGSHQDKEEQVLLPALLAATSADDQRCVRAHLEVHASERRLLDELRAGFEAAAYGDPLSLDLFVSRARAYARFQREHAAKEDAQLLPLAERVLGAEADAELVAGFERIDRRVQRDVPCKARSARAVRS